MRRPNYGNAYEVLLAMFVMTCFVFLWHHEDPFLLVSTGQRSWCMIIHDDMSDEGTWTEPTLKYQPRFLSRLDSACL